MPETLIPDEGQVLAVDPGAKRVGLACGGFLGIASPLGRLDAEPAAALPEKIAALARSRGCVGIVVGLPLNMDGSEGPQARRARKLAAALAVAGLPVELCDERLTSWEAERDLAGLGLTRRQKKEHVDALAAMKILGSFLAVRDSRRRRSSPPEAEPQAGSAGP
jgi:putative Holliday junction resolvase